MSFQNALARLARFSKQLGTSTALSAVVLSASWAAAPVTIAQQPQQQQAQPSAEELAQIGRMELPVTHFYLTGDLPATFQAIDQAVSTSSTSAVMNFEVLALFYAELYRRDIRVMGPVIQHFSRYKNDLNVLPWMAAWLANTPEALAQVEKLKEAGYVEPHKIITSAKQLDYRKVYPRDRLTIDALWTLYYATGNPQDAAMVVETALFDQKNDDGEAAIADADTAAAIKNYATGSVIVHAAKHQAVMELLNRLSRSVPPAAKERLDRMISSSQQLSAAARATASAEN